MAAVDTLYVDILSYIRLHFVLIQGAFLSLRERCVERLPLGPLLTPDGLHNSEELEKLMRGEMRKITNHLKNIYILCQFLESFYRSIMMLQLILPTVMLCNLMYIILVAPMDQDLIFMNISFMSVMVLQVTLYCWYANEVTEEASKIPSSLWQSDWLDASIRFKKDMVFVIRRANKPLYLTAGNMINMTLETLMKVFKYSYSFFAVLQT